jgi:hypothetical protein
MKIFFHLHDLVNLAPSVSCLSPTKQQLEQSENAFEHLRGTHTTSRRRLQYLVSFVDTRSPPLLRPQLVRLVRTLRLGEVFCVLEL